MKLILLLTSLALVGCGTTLRTSDGTAMHTDSDAAYFRLKTARGDVLEAWSLDHSKLAKARWQGVTSGVTALGGAALLH